MLVKSSSCVSSCAAAVCAGCSLLCAVRCMKGNQLSAAFCPFDMETFCIRSEDVILTAM